MRTSYFAKYSRLPQEEKDKYLPIAISTSVPKWFTECYDHIIELAPPQHLVYKLKNGMVEISEFAVEYIEMLKQWVKLDICIQYLEFLEETYGKEVVLLCYEKSDDFCHRQLLVNYIKNVYDNDIQEL